MGKEYFSHDYHTRNKKKLGAMIHKYKVKGYGLFWIIVEMLHEDSTNWMDLDEYSYNSIAKESGCTAKFVEEFISDCINKFQVFIEKEKKFSTERTLENIQKREEIKISRSKAGKASADAKKANPESNTSSTHVEQPLTPVQQNSTKEKKGKEIKGKNKELGANAPQPTPIDKYSEEQLLQFSKFQKWLLENAEDVSKMDQPFTIKQFFKARESSDLKVMMELLTKMGNWKDLRKKNKSAYITFRNWKKMDEDRNKKPGYENELNLNDKIKADLKVV